MIRLFLISIISLLLFSACSKQTLHAVIYNKPSIYEYKHFPYRVVKAQNPQAHEVSSFGVYKIKNSEDIAKKLKHTGSTAFMVFKNDSLIAIWRPNEKNEKKRSNPFSATKSVVNILIGIAIKEGKIKSIEDPVAMYYTPFRKQGMDTIKIKNFMQMSSGVSYHDDARLHGQLAKLFYGDDIKNLTDSLHSELPPASRFEYKNMDPQVLTLMLREVVNMPISEYASQKLWSKIGAESDALWTIDKNENGDERSYCCMNTTATDLVRIGLLYNHFGNWKGEQIIDSSYVKQTIVPHGNPDKKGNPTSNYGLLWWTRNVDNGGDYTADGMYGQYVAVLSKENIVFVRFGKRDKSKDFKEKETAKIPPLYQYLVREVRKRWGS